MCIALDVGEDGVDYSHSTGIYLCAFFVVGALFHPVSMVEMGEHYLMMNMFDWVESLTLLD